MNTPSIIALVAIATIGTIVGKKAPVDYKYLIGYCFGALATVIPLILNKI